MTTFLDINVRNYSEAVEQIKRHPNKKIWTLIGEPGSGKTTLFPYYCVKSGKKVFCTMPTKLGVYSSSKYVRSDKFIASDDDFKETIGTCVDSKKEYKNSKLDFIMKELGHSVQENEDVDSNLVYCVNGHFKKIMKSLLLYVKEFEDVDNLKFCDIIMVDEVHLNKKEQEMIIRYWEALNKYRNIKLPILIKVSATYTGSGDIIRFVKNEETIIRKIRYLEDYEEIFSLLDDTKIKTIIQNMHRILFYMIEKINGLFKRKHFVPQGVALIFLPGISSIREVAKNIEREFEREISNIGSFSIMVAHSTMSPDHLKSILEPKPSNIKWKIVLATDICETSLTIPNVNLVISSMYKRDLFEGDEGTTILKTVNISKRSADQQSGRTGRETSGIVLRLIEKVNYERFIEKDVAELVRLPIHKEILEVVSVGLTPDVFFRDLSISTKILKTLEELKRLNCIVKKSITQTINECGEIVSMIPLSLHSSLIIYRGILNSKANESYNVFPDIVMAVALDFYQDIFEKQSDHKSTYPLLPILLPYLKLYARSDIDVIKPSESKIRKFCKGERLIFDSFYESLTRMNEIFNYLLNNLRVNVSIGFFKPDVVLKRLLQYAETIFPLLIKENDCYKTHKGIKYKTDRTFYEREEDNDLEDETEQSDKNIIALSSYRRPDSKRDGIIITKIYIPTKFRKLTSEEKEIFNFFYEDLPESKDRDEEQEELKNKEEDDYSSSRIAVGEDDF